MPLSLTLPDETATLSLAQSLAACCRPGDVLALSGDLGLGKTSLARAFIRHLTNPDEDVPSPSFTLVQTYDTPRGLIWHFDLYRLTEPEDIDELGFDEALGQGIVLVEWPDRLGRLIPTDRLDLTLLPGMDAQSRRVELREIGRSDWLARRERENPVS